MRLQNKKEKKMFRKGIIEMKKVLAMMLVAVMMLCVSVTAFADGPVSLGQAKQIALERASVSASEANFTKARQDWDDGRQVYEIELWVGSTEYEMDVDVMTGTVSDFHVDYHGGGVQPSYRGGSYRYDDDWDDLFDWDLDDRYDDWDDRYDNDWDDLFDWD